MWTVSYWKQLIEDAVVGASTALIALLGDGANLWAVDWKAAVGIGGGAALVAFLKGLTAKNVGTPGTTSYVKYDAP
jgi:hypothetical protein